VLQSLYTTSGETHFALGGDGMNSRWSKNVIRSAVPLSRVIADLTGQQPGKRGRETLVRCPFHHDTKPSLRIND